MDQELLIIELLSAAEPIYKRARKNRQKNLVSAFLFLIIASVLFFGIGSFVYQQLEMRVRSIDSHQGRSDNQRDPHIKLHFFLRQLADGF